eukprot:TRINITY_DN607_c0_g1_i13.p1 TRINITY_DN607_c0_g1~~TRINITY_DN607_c0_g1_i13.p1  ORF type:complete len:477 (-),score=93.10 TRINITY_DN607_c0_g1_i13:247-1677(-)
MSEAGVMLSLDEALNELGMLSSASRYKKEYIQDIEAKFERRKAENAKWLKWQQRADIVREDSCESSAANNGHHQNAQLNGEVSTNNGLLTANRAPSTNSQQHQPSSSATPWGGGLNHSNHSSSNSISIQINQEAGAGVNNGFIPTGENAMMTPQSNLIPNPLMNVPHIPTVSAPTSTAMLRGGLCRPPPPPLLSTAPCISRDSQYVTNITINHNNQNVVIAKGSPYSPGSSPYSAGGCCPYPNLKLENDAYHNRRMQFKPRRMWNGSHRPQYSSPYRVISLPPAMPHLPGTTTGVQSYGNRAPNAAGPNHPAPSYAELKLSGLKLSGVLTSFKHRTFRTRARVRFCVAEENTEDLTAQLANIKLDTSSFTNMQNTNQRPIKGRTPLTSPPPPATNSSEDHDVVFRRESTPGGTGGSNGGGLSDDDAECLRSSQRQRRLIIEPRSRHMSLEPNDPLMMRSEVLATSLNNLDLEENSD